MRTIVVAAAIAALAAVTTGSAATPAPTRGQALLALNEALEDEREALALLQKTPPRVGTAFARIERSLGELETVRAFAATVAGPAEKAVYDAQSGDHGAHATLYYALNGGEPSDLVIKYLEKALAAKTRAMPLIRTAKPPAGPPQCADRKDNDGDGVVDAKDEPGCNSPSDVRESTALTCNALTKIASGRLVITGSCSGAFTEVDYRLLDSQMSGRVDVAHAPSCGPAALDGIRCTAKDGLQNPRHLFEARMTTTLQDRGQRVRVRFFNKRKRLVAEALAGPPR